MNDYPSERVLADIFATAQDLTAAGFAVEMHISNLGHSLVRVDVWDSAECSTNALAPAEEGETAPIIASTGDDRVGWVVYDHNHFARLFALHDAMCELLRTRINVEEVEL